MNKSLFKWEFYGVFIMFIFFSLFHFTYELTGFKFFALFSAVNESVWEHLKIGFYAGLLFYFVEYSFIGKYSPNFLPAKALALYVIPVFIMITFYGYTSILGRHYLWLDILIAFLSCVAAQIVSYSIISSKNDFSEFSKTAIILILLGIVVFTLFTFYPPRIPLFFDKSNNKFGI